jgi:hypothetical protein
LRLAKLTHDVALQLHGDKYDLASGGLRHLLQGLELTDLHGGWGSEDVGGLTHEPRGVDLCAGGDDLALADALLLRGAGERGGDLGGEDDVLDEDALDRDPPLVRDVADDLGDLKRDRFALRHDGLHGARAHDVSEGRLCALYQSLAQIRDAECGAVRVRDLEIDDGVSVVVFLRSHGFGQYHTRNKKKRESGVRVRFRMGFRAGEATYISTLTLSRVMTVCRPMEMIWILTSTMRSDSVQTLTWTKPGSTAL